MIYLAGPGHGGPAAGRRRLAGGQLHRDLSRTSPATPAGMRRLFRQFSTPGGIPSHVSVTTPGLDPRGRRARLRARARLRRGHGQPGPDRARRRRRRRGRDRAAGGFLEGHLVPQPRTGRRRPAVLHLNGAKIAGPTVLGRKDPAEVRSLLEGHGYDVLEVEGDDLPGHAPPLRRGAGAGLGAGSAPSRQAARGGNWDGTRPRWPMIVLRSPEGLDRARRGRRRADAGHLPRAPGAALRRPGEPGAPRAARGVAAVLPSRGALRRRRRADRARPAGQPAGRCG